MWQAIGQDLDGKDRDVPWSAAAISFIVRQAGTEFETYRRFKFAAAHSRYLHDSIVKRNAADQRAPFWGFRLHERRPAIGDIVARWRETPRTFDDAVHSDSFKSHTDIIISISPDFVLAMGGNVQQSMNITRYKKTPSGFVAADGEAMMLMVNNG